MMDGTISLVAPGKEEEMEPLLWSLDAVVSSETNMAILDYMQERIETAMKKALAIVVANAPIR